MTVLILAGVSFLAWFLSMLAGGGSPIVLIPVITLLLGSQAVAPVITTGLLVGNTQRSLFFWRDIDWQVTAWYAPGAIAGALLGAYAFTHIHLEWLQGFLALALLLMVANFWLNRWLSRQLWQVSIQAWHFLPYAFLNAIASALVGSTGPIMNPLYLGYGLEKEAMIATKSANKAFLHLVKLLSYLTLGVLDTSHLGYGLVIGLAAIPANWLGKQVLARMSNDQFRQAVFTFIAVSGVLMLWQQRTWIPAWGV
ncbi:sulfite exporter TauE/SafE family protein [Leptolyngbya sp. PCC 6406]|uniref:sulfite exporter TauE/SafE family protein n=1 Tax=Leptolyngbya sp. PCC 6406 TaxID=1173264 RepID=UPI0002AC045E|nr:sulfite exporter TauE/SafE family protein [Leptolyngbya sp. PCC 6406]